MELDKPSADPQPTEPNKTTESRSQEDALPNQKEVGEPVRARIPQKTQGSWQKIIHHRHRKGPNVEVDEEMERRYSQAMDVLQVLGSLGS